MNSIKAIIKEIKKHQNISAITFDALGVEMSMVALELDDKLQIGMQVNIKAKATNISLAKHIENTLSISNQLQGVVEEINNGTILCNVKIKIEDTIIESIITQNSASNMDIKTGDRIIALIKATDISIVP
jgi:molybdopterin-binding protein